MLVKEPGVTLNGLIFLTRIGVKIGIDSPLPLVGVVGPSLSLSCSCGAFLYITLIVSSLRYGCDLSGTAGMTGAGIFNSLRCSTSVCVIEVIVAEGDEYPSLFLINSLYAYARNRSTSSRNNTAATSCCILLNLRSGVTSG